MENVQECSTLEERSSAQSQKTQNLLQQTVNLRNLRTIYQQSRTLSSE